MTSNTATLQIKTVELSLINRLPINKIIKISTAKISMDKISTANLPINNTDKISLANLLIISNNTDKISLLPQVPITIQMAILTTTETRPITKASTTLAIQIQTHKT